VKTKAHFRKIVLFHKSVIYDSEDKVCGIIGIVNEVSHNVSQHNIATKKLTTRELEVLHLLIKGESVKSIALDMRISPHTAGGHMKSIYTKLDVHSKNEALYKALSLT
jgi:DNA-binding NarL/FixJ family response regulator